MTLTDTRLPFTTLFRSSEISHNSATTTVEDRRLWRSFLSESQLENLVQPASTLAPGDLLHYIINLENNRLNSHQFRLAFWQMVSIPIGIIADRKSTRLNSSHSCATRMPSSA